MRNPPKTLLMCVYDDDSVEIYNNGIPVGTVKHDKFTPHVLNAFDKPTFYTPVDNKTIQNVLRKALDWFSSQT